jgi:hypothetical protein
MLEIGKIYQVFGRSNYPLRCPHKGFVDLYDLFVDDVFMVIEIRKRYSKVPYTSEYKILTTDGIICYLSADDRWDERDVWYFKHVK